MVTTYRTKARDRKITGTKQKREGKVQSRSELLVTMSNNEMINEQIEKKVNQFVKDQSQKSLKFDPMDKLQRSIV